MYLANMLDFIAHIMALWSITGSLQIQHPGPYPAIPWAAIQPVLQAA